MADALSVLVIDDDENICQLVRLYLEKEGYRVGVAHTGAAGLAAIERDRPDLVILDIMLPGMDGWDVCRNIRKTSNVPIIMLTAKGETFDKVLGLELGADDYIVKPFDPKELVARVRAVIRRMGAREEETARELSFQELHINLTNYVVTYFGREMELPPKEMELLYFLASHSNIVFTREQLLEQVWGFDYFGDSRTVDVHIKRLREKFPVEAPVNWRIKTVWGVGYKFEVK
ncbi:MAG: response regulator transcription factor [Clostridiales bacterium]|nr:response regulator transcription factor [Clostridiales bacterium]